VSVGEHDFEVMASIESLYRIASNNDQAADFGLSPVELRIRATLALAVFLPHAQAKKHLINLMASSEVPKEVRSVASQALTGGSDTASGEPLTTRGI
jgi:hypothetical protein